MNDIIPFNFTYSIIILKTDIIPYRVPISNQYNSTITAVKSQEVRRLMYI